MLRSLTDFIAEIAGGAREASAFAENDYRLAAAALLVHVVTIDGVIGADEMDKLRRLLAARFALSEDDAEKLLEAAIARDAEAVDLYAFTSVLNRAMDEEGRRRVVEMMFEVAYADGGLTEFEDNLVWRAAELLNITSRDRVDIRKRVRDTFEG
ncbi:putative tellurite resistance protein B-like protein [Ancylobacter aquaticus]|uniref:Putative tellurite resistance protein B-like protein n=1 Tax=Ancylobacter aquaticus TaxID=100 RepID=A0A4R1HMQ5_ANCAQ|nr:TerB family tellurite resistance protein [Ancylobacter aquaticus]TCK23787.1 putative tellurite resistance protein B-like protein [Ancylobacter aquaticus]